MYIARQHKFLLAAGLLFSLIVNANDLLTVVRQPKKNIAEKTTHDLSQQLVVGSHPENLLTHEAAVTLQREGGPLGATALKIRGLSDARSQVELEGIGLNDPTTGSVDVNDLPLFAVKRMSIGDLGGSSSNDLSLTLPSEHENYAEARAGMGSFSTGQISVVAQKSDGPYAALVGFQAATTRGDFPFAATSVTGAELNHLLVRQNNDRQRTQFLLRGIMPVFGWKATLLSIGNLHEGGVPGFAHSPTNNWRQNSVLGGGHLKLDKDVANVHVTLASHSRYHRNTGWESLSPGTAQSMSSMEHGASATLSKIISPSVRGKLAGFGAYSHIFENQFSRLSAGSKTSAAWRLSSQIPIQLSSFAGVMVYSDVGVLFDCGAGLVLKPVTAMRVGLDASRTARPPTLSELYGYQGVVLGNQSLKPESLYDVSVFADWRGSIWATKFSVFAGFLERGIFYINQNAFEILPVNTAGGWRTGTEMSAELRPVNYLKLRAQTQLLYTRLLATAAPLPGAQPISTSVTAQLGKEGGIINVVQWKYQGASSSNLYGTLRTTPVYMVDWLLKIPLQLNLFVNMSVTNIFNVLNARDSHQFPLPGREVFISIQSNYME